MYLYCDLTHHHKAVYNLLTIFEISFRCCYTVSFLRQTAKQIGLFVPERVVEGSAVLFPQIETRWLHFKPLFGAFVLFGRIWWKRTTIVYLHSIRVNTFLSHFYSRR